MKEQELKQEIKSFERNQFIDISTLNRLAILKAELKGIQTAKKEFAKWLKDLKKWLDDNDIPNDLYVDIKEKLKELQSQQETSQVGSKDPYNFVAINDSRTDEKDNPDTLISKKKVVEIIDKWWNVIEFNCGEDFNIMRKKVEELKKELGRK